MLAAFCVALGLLPSSSYAIEPWEVEIVHESEMAKNALFDSALLWMAENFTSSKEVIELRDKELGTIIGNGVVETKRTWLGSTMFRYKLKIDVKDKKYRLTFRDVWLIAEPSDIRIEDANFKMLEPKARQSFAEIADSLSGYLERAKSSEDW